MSCSEPQFTTTTTCTCTDSESQQEPANLVTYIELPASSSSSASDDQSSIVPPDEPPENLPFTVGANIGVTKTKFTLKQDSPRQRGNEPTPRQHHQQLELLAFDLGVDSATSTSSSSGSITTTGNHVGDPAASETSSCGCNCPPNREDDIGDADIEYTLCIIKPEAMKHRAAIEARIEAGGFRVCGQRLVHLTWDEATDFYLDQEPARDQETMCLIEHLSSGPVLAMILSRVSAIDAWKRLAGPRGSWQQARSLGLDSLRGTFGSFEKSSEEPVVHASKDKRSARREIHFFFPDHELDDVSVEARLNFYKREIKDTLLQGLVKCFQREPKPKNPIKWLGYWLLDNDPKAPRFHCYLNPPTGEEDDSVVSQAKC